MNSKAIGIILIIFFLSVVSVSAADENITSDDIISTNIDDNLSSTSTDPVEDVLEVSVEDNVSSTCDDSAEDNLSSSSAEQVEDVLEVSVEDNVSVSNVDESKLSVNVEDTSKLSQSDDSVVVSMSVSQQNSKLSSIYDKVYSHDEWKSILLVKFKVKKSWPKSKRDKKIRKYWKKALKKSSKLVRKYTREGWIYDGRQWQWQVGTSKVSYQYYVQFYQTQYYNGYGERVA